MGPLLVLTVLLSPFGVLLFLGLRAGVRRRHRLTITPRPGSPDDRPQVALRPRDTAARGQSP